MNTTQTTESSACSESEQEIQRKFERQEQHFETQAKLISTLRAFFAKHRDQFAPFHWSCYSWNEHICFDADDWHGQNARDIARAFGAQGWKREANRFTCGEINWVKELDGIKLVIENAEQIKPKLMEEVRL